MTASTLIYSELLFFLALPPHLLGQETLNLAKETNRRSNFTEILTLHEHLLAPK